jgi:RuvB-like protein 2
VAEKRKSPKVEVEDVARAYSLFIDVKRSTDYMLEHQEQYLYNEAPLNADEGEAMQQ